MSPTPDDTFTLRDGRVVRWCAATDADHDERIAMRVEAEAAAVRNVGKANNVEAGE